MAFGLDLLRRYSDEDIEELVRRNPELRFERMADGRLLVSPPTGWRGGTRNALLVHRLTQWNQEAGGGGRTFDSSAGFTLPDGALFAPDAAWLSAARFDELVRRQPLDKFAPVCPDLLFEIVSPSDRIPLVRRKIETYANNGARCAVLIDPERHAVEVTAEGRVEVVEAPRNLVVPLKLLPGAAAPLDLDLDRIIA